VEADVLALALALLAATNWEPVDGVQGFKLFTRDNGSDTREMLAVTTIDVPPWVVKNAVDDFEATAGRMPFLTEVRVLKKDADEALVYNRTSAPLIADRDYTIRVYDDSFVRDDGEVIYIQRWRAANDEGPDEKPGVVRVERTEGYWQFEPIEGGARTRATYFLVATAEGIPKQLADWGTQNVLSSIFAAVRDRADEPKYRENQPVVTARR
jgi:hypothetical protein